MKKDLILFGLILLALTILQHPDFLTDPIKRIQNLPDAGAYGLGMFHPIVFTLIIFIFVKVIIFTFKKIKNLIRK